MNGVFQADTNRQLKYNQSAELKVYLMPGDVLYLPAFWGNDLNGCVSRCPV